ncbi:MAG: flagellar basal body P-ring protein FlgI [Paucibacter sp.]|nr:flagellar basal body P-ring protein FlgI [Roseateles sp.]
MRLLPFFARSIVLLALAGTAHAARIKEVASVAGVRTNLLTGYGLVVGLDGTGDQTTQAPFTQQSLTAMLQANGVILPQGITMQPRNIAAVMVTAELPAFAQPGQKIDINVSSMGNAKSLRGGTLIVTPLKGADGQIYALAQGNVVIVGAGASANGSKVQVNQLASGRIPNGAQVERSVASNVQGGDSIQLDLNAADFATARAVAKAINRAKGEGTAQALDGRVVKVQAPTTPDERVGFLADLENLPVDLSTPAARVVVNARTGSIVMNQAVTLNNCAVAHGNLSVTISTTPQVSQPNALSGGQTVVTQKSDITIKQEPGPLIQMPASANLADVVKALSALGATPQDLLAILQAMKTAGALNAELEVI